MDIIHSINEPKEYLKTDFTYEEFVELHQNEMFDVSMQYPILGMKNAVNKCMMRKEVYNLLCKASLKLPKGFKFKILDAWRPFELQKELYIEYSEKIIKEFKLEALCNEEREKFIRKFVSIPVLDRKLPPVHTTGGAVDLTIIDSNGKELDMGTSFDAFTEKTYTAYFENGDNNIIRDNRRLLHNTMCEAGFTNLPSEWWHYDYGDRFWAFYNNKPAIYEGVFTLEELYEKH